MNAQMTNEEQLKQDVAAAVDAGWSQFEAEHPELDRAIDRLLLADHVADSLSDDPQFTAAYEAALEASVGANALGSLVRRFVDVVLARLK